MAFVLQMRFSLWVYFAQVKTQLSVTKDPNTDFS